MELLAVVRALHLAATVGVAGAFAFRFLVLRQAEAEAVARWLRLICAWGVALALASWLIWLVLLSASMSGRPIAEVNADVLGTVLAHTTFGHAWILRSALLLMLAASLALSHRAARLDAFAATLAVGALVSLAWTGHARGTSPWHLVSDALHLLGAGLWLGALLPLLLVLGRARAAVAPSTWRALANTCTRRFSGLGFIAMAMLVGSGLVNASFLVGSFPAIASPYGKLLAVKLTLFVAILALAAINRWKLTPSEAFRPLWRNALVELCLGAGILAIVGMLGIASPPTHDQGPMHHMQHEAAHDSVN